MTWSRLLGIMVLVLLVSNCQRSENSPELRARDALFGIADGVERDFRVAN